MAKITEEMALHYHEKGKPGKIEITPTKPYSTQRDLSLAYSPGVAFPCLEIEKKPEDVYRYTDKGNLVGVISNGTAVLGLGDIGALAGKPVMEGKALLFKIFAGIDAFDIEINEKDPKKFIEVVKSLEPTFGGINLEDIKSPECFEIEQTLKKECHIPVMHDDQHGTAIISGAGLLNALEIQHKNIGEVRLVVNGAGAAAISCTRLYVRLGINPENIVMCDSKGVIRADREHLSDEKKEFATTRDLHTLAEAMVDADVFLGLSVANVVTPEMVKSMALNPIVFALANPDPEISYELAKSTRDDIIVATGRSDYPNQINNVIGFPYIFRGALDCQASMINEDMKIGAAYAIAALAKQPVPSIVDEAYGLSSLSFGRDYILPKALDPRLLTCVAPAVAKAAAESGVANKPITDWNAYNEKLKELMGDDGEMLRSITEYVKGNRKRVVFAEGNSENQLRAAYQLNLDGVCTPILLGNAEMINKHAERLKINIKDIEIINPRHDSQAKKREIYAGHLFEKRQREGVTYAQAVDKMYDRSTYAMMMVMENDADAVILGTYSAANDILTEAERIVGIKEGYKHFATMHILNTRRGRFFLADTAINPVSNEDALVDIARLTYEAVNFLSNKPVLAMLSYSNFGSNGNEEEPMRIRKAVEILHEKYPEIPVEGEMQANFALDTKLRDKTYPFNTIAGEQVNTLIFPNLSSANTVYQMMLSLGVGSMVGPIQLGLRKPVYFVHNSASVRSIMDLTTLACLDACMHI